MNETYPELEFILLDYNSSDGLQNWVKSEMSEYIENGKLKFYRTEDPKEFSLCHSKNMAIKLSSNEIVGIIDADNYAGLNYASWINEMFTANGPDTVITTIRKQYIPFRDIGGKVAFHRDLFERTRGFDESWVGYGFDDVDLISRLEDNGGKRIFIEKEAHLNYIGHSHFERLANNHLMNNVVEIYECNSISDTHSIMYFFKDGCFSKIDYSIGNEMSNNQFLTYNGWSIINDRWTKGKYSLVENNYILSDMYQQSVLNERMNSISDEIIDISNEWRVTSPENYIDLILRYSECIGRIKYHFNNAERIQVNKNSWGSGVVFENFSNNKIHIL